MFSAVTAILMVDDVNKSMRFYTQTLGLEMQGGLLESFEETTNAEESTAMIFVMLGVGEQKLMLQRRDSLEQDMPFLQGKPIASSIALYFETDDVNELYQKVKKSVKILIEPVTKFYGMREFTFTDDSGYVITLAQRVETK